MPVGPPDRGSQDGAHVGPCRGGRPRRAGHTQGGHAEPPVDQHPVPERVDQVRADQREHHRPDVVRALEIAPERRVQQQERCAENQHREVAAEQRLRFGVNAERGNRQQHRHHHHHQRHRRHQRELHAAGEPAAAQQEIARAIGLGHQRVETEQQAHAENREAEMHRVADARGADRGRAERAHHDRVDHAHPHPAQLGQDDRHRQAQGRLQFCSQHDPWILP